MELPGRGCRCRISLAKSEVLPPTAEAGGEEEEDGVVGVLGVEPAFGRNVDAGWVARKCVTALVMTTAKFFRPAAQ